MKAGAVLALAALNVVGALAACAPTQTEPPAELEVTYYHLTF